MISLIVDWEEVEEGTWAQAAQSGELYRLTKRLADDQSASTARKVEFDEQKDQYPVSRYTGAG